MTQLEMKKLTSLIEVEKRNCLLLIFFLLIREGLTQKALAYKLITLLKLPTR